MLRKFILDPLQVLQPQAVEPNEDLTYEEYPRAIVDRQVCQLHSKDILTLKVLRSNDTAEDCAWEIKAMMRVAYL